MAVGTIGAPRRGDLRQHILRTALHLFTSDGYFNTSVHHIQRAAGVSIGSIYNHFGGKEGIARALYRDLLDRMNVLVDAAIAGRPDTYSQGLSLVESLFEMTESDPEVIGFVLNAKHREFLPDEPPICSSEPFARMRAVLQQGMDTGELRPMDLMIASSCAYGPALRMISLRLDGLLETRLPLYTEPVWEAAWRSIRSAALAQDGISVGTSPSQPVLGASERSST
jgi:AcrR family transcriptional regulator